MVKAHKHYTSRTYNTWSAAKWRNISCHQLLYIKESFQDVFKGIGKHKYCQVQLFIDNNLKLIIQPQCKIPFIKREILNKMLDEVGELGVIKQVEGLTGWLPNLVLRHKADPTQIRMNINMTTASTAI